jgi:hypothetical protein
MKKPQAPHFKERSFGVSVGAVLLGVTAYLLWRGRFTAATITGSVGAVLLFFGLTYPPILKYPSAAWWKLAMVLGYVNARVILTVAFTVVLAPMGLLWRLIGKDPLSRRKHNWPGWSPSPARFRDPNHFNRMY